MARYFFDTDDGKSTVLDKFGIDLTRLGDARDAARDLLFDLGHAEMLKGTDRVFTATVRNDQGLAIYRASMTLRVDF